MTTFLFSGWTLTFISITVVFAALLILCAVYSLMGYFVERAKMPKVPKKFKRVRKNSDQVAAAIALSLQMEAGNDTIAAIALAIDMERTDIKHDTESGIITINNSSNLSWGNKALNFRVAPKKIDNYGTV